MKTTLFLRLAGGLLLLFGSLAGHAQGPPPAALPGYWNLEINRTTRDYTIVRFYGGQDRLVHEERLASLCLDLARPGRRSRRTTHQLNQALARVLHGPAAALAPTVLAQQLGQDRRLQHLYATR
ncbi:hypothetical protein [Hymenobacter sp. UYCo722]|uniref:hypothetical protein n=1 Tax=Hymenobacter sp. UYCo722 TaxID=3156335 RepID=UPI00339A4EF3